MDIHLIVTKLSEINNISLTFTNPIKYLSPIIELINSQLQMVISDQKNYKKQNENLKNKINSISQSIGYIYNFDYPFQNLIIERMFLNDIEKLMEGRSNLLKERIEKMKMEIGEELIKIKGNVISKWEQESVISKWEKENEFNSFSELNETFVDFKIEECEINGSKIVDNDELENIHSELGKVNDEVSIEQMDVLVKLKSKLKRIINQAELHRMYNMKEIKKLSSELHLPLKKDIPLMEIEAYRKVLEREKEGRSAFLDKINKRILELNEILDEKVEVNYCLSVKNIEKSKRNLEFLEMEENRRINEIYIKTRNSLRDHLSIFGINESTVLDEKESEYLDNLVNEVANRSQNNNDLNGKDNMKVKIEEDGSFIKRAKKENSGGLPNTEIQRKSVEFKWNFYENDQRIEYIKAVINKMRQKIEELAPKRESYLSVLQIVHKREAFLKKMIEFEKMASDPKRLFKNSVQLLNEEKFRKNAVPRLLEIESLLFSEIKEYENIFGTFEVEGEDYKVKLENEIKSRIINKTTFIHHRDTPRKRS